MVKKQNLMGISTVDFALVGKSLCVANVKFGLIDELRKASQLTAYLVLLISYVMRHILLGE